MARDSETITATMIQIAEALGETKDVPRRQIGRIVHTLGPERAQAFAAQALETEAKGGMLLPDGSRTRTVGGIFFYLVRGGITPKERWRIWPQRTTPQQPTGGGSALAELALLAKTFVDATRAGTLTSTSGPSTVGFARGVSSQWARPSRRCRWRFLMPAPHLTAS